MKTTRESLFQVLTQLSVLYPTMRFGQLIEMIATLDGARSVSEIADRLKLHSLQQRKWHVQATSATTGDGLFEGLGWAANVLKTRKNGLTF